MKTHLKRTLIRNMTMFVAFAAAFLIVKALMPTAMVWGEREEQPANGQPSPVQLLIEEHDCWTDEVPEDMQGEIPGHVVVTRDANKGPEYLGANWTGRALEQIFGDEDHDIATIHAFCR